MNTWNSENLVQFRIIGNFNFIILVSGQGSAIKGSFKRRRYNKMTRERISKRIRLLQEELDKEELNFVATI